MTWSYNSVLNDGLISTFNVLRAFRKNSMS